MLLGLVMQPSLSSTRVHLPLKHCSNSAGGRDVTLLESNPAGHGQFDLGSQRDFAQKTKSRTDSFSPLPHPLETPVPGASPLQFLRIDSAPIVAHGDA